MVISVGDHVKDIKEGELVFMGIQGGVDYALKRNIIINDVFPRVRTFTMMSFEDHNVKMLIDVDPTILTSREQEVNVDREESNYQDELKSIKFKETVIN